MEAEIQVKDDGGFDQSDDGGLDQSNDGGLDQSDDDGDPVKSYLDNILKNQKDFMG